ncbi:hypothetical protein PVAG01_02549 [Phlyctema vagabunda]|uniref:PH domain-containing protein n=1 Tax=Phlyctema vagabunda TaxID=108571 RepID=A0ABR4PQZ6_9HELO
MEGFLMVPPERGTLIGRAVWKPRYIVLGSAARIETPPENVLPRSVSTGRIANARKGLKASSSKPSLADITESVPAGLYVSIYKAKGDWEFIAQHPVASFETCDIQSVQHRKQGPSAPTLVINLKPDIETEKQRKRRSSRTGGLTSSKDPWANTLLFRTVPEERYNIYDWQITIKPVMESLGSGDDVLSPISPSFSSFTNPFPSRPVSSSQRPDYQRAISAQTTSSYAYAQRERPSAMISPSPSLRSRRSDLSSQASSHPPGFGAPTQQHYTTVLPADLPSPASTVGYDMQPIDGWASQGRSSALSSHTRGSNSIASAAPVGGIASTPPGPRETILDRAFKNRVIPGGDRVHDKDEDQISSIAKFEALMKEVDEKKEQRYSSSKQDPKNIQGWELDEDSEDSDYEEAEDDEDDGCEGLQMEDEGIVIPTPAQRALEYISGRRPPSSSHNRPLSPTSRSPPIPFLNQQAMSAFHGSFETAGGLRPRTGTNSRPSSLALPARSTTIASSLRDNNSSLSVSERDKRNSTNSAKRLSFSEFARRLSSTSSLLLVQTNASSSSTSQNSKQGGSESNTPAEASDEGPARSGLRNSVSLHGGSGSAVPDKRCGWRGSVGVFGNESGSFM